MPKDLDEWTDCEESNAGFPKFPRKSRNSGLDLTETMPGHAFLLTRCRPLERAFTHSRGLARIAFAVTFAALMALAFPASTAAQTNSDQARAERYFSFVLKEWRLDFKPSARADKVVYRETGRHLTDKEKAAIEGAFDRIYGEPALVVHAVSLAESPQAALAMPPKEVVKLTGRELGALFREGLGRLPSEPLVGLLDVIAEAITSVSPADCKRSFVNAQLTLAQKEKLNQLLSQQMLMPGRIDVFAAAIVEGARKSRPTLQTTPEQAKEAAAAHEKTAKATARREGTLLIFGRLGRGEVLPDQDYCTVTRTLIMSVKDVAEPHRRHLLQHYVSGL